MNYDKLYKNLPYLVEAGVSITHDLFTKTFIINSGNPERKLTEFEKDDLSKTIIYFQKMEGHVDPQLKFEFKEIDDIPMEVETEFINLPAPMIADEVPLEGN